MIRSCYLLIMFFVLLPADVQAAVHDIISEIRFTGNEITQESVFRREMFIKEGDPVNLKKITESTQAIMDLGLYRSVKYKLLDTDEPHRKILEIKVWEKFYKLVIPRLRYENNQWHTGLQLRWDNVNGLDHQLKLIAERLGGEMGVSELRQQFKYKYPNVLGSKYSLDIRLINKNKVDASIDNVFQNQLDQSFDLGVFKWLNKQHRKKGWFIRLGYDVRERQYEDLDTREIVDSTSSVQLSLKYAYKNIHEYYYNRGGKYYGYEIKVAEDAIGSETEYIKHYLFYRSYYRFKSRPDDNLNVQTILGAANDNVLGDRAFTLDYRNGLRGYERSRFQGNSMLVVNTEYLRPSTWFPTLRFVYFLDMGTTGDTLGDAFTGPLRTGIGAGIRWKIPALVRVDLRVDVGYGITDKNVRVTVGTRHAF